MNTTSALSRTISIQSLQDGTKFQIPTLKDTMRKCEVVRVGSCSVLIKGEKRDGLGAEDFWKPFKYDIASTTQVIPVDSHPETKDEKPVKPVVVNESGEVVKRGRGRPRKNPSDTPTVKKESTGKRGRPAKNLTINFPAGKDFTLEDVAVALGIEKYHITNYLNREQKLGNELPIKEVGQRVGGRGKPAKIYRLK